jgi:hypothetical protein
MRGCGREDVGQHCLRLLTDLTIREAEHDEPMAVEPGVAIGVGDKVM